MLTLIDSYSENYATSNNLLCSGYERVGQSFTSDGNYNISSAKFYILRGGSPTGYVYAKLYAHSGTYGETSLPTGDALATSNAIDVASISTDLSLVEFTFSTPYTIQAGNYFILLEYTGGNTSNCIAVRYDNSSLAHTGNYARYTGGSWVVNALRDLCFYVYGNPAATPNTTNFFQFF